MALVRCTCLGWLAAPDGHVELQVTVADPECGYAPHRLVQLENATEPA